MKNQMNNGINVLSIALAGLVFLLAGCDKGNNIPNVDHISPDFEVVRSEVELRSIDSTTTDPVIDSILGLHPVYWDLYFNNILVAQLNGVQDPQHRIAARTPSSDSRMQVIQEAVDEEYRNIDDIKAGFYEAFQYFEYHFPGNKAPNIYTLISDFGYFPFIFEDDGSRDGIGISLEMFLGHDFPYREFTGNHPVFSSYLTRTYNRDHIVKKSLDIILDDMLGPAPGDRLLDVMIHNGKRNYMLKQIMPESPDSIIFEFTPEQVVWCNENERNLWAHYLTEDLIYSNEFAKINKLVNPSPRVPGMPDEAPGRVANWNGYQIVSQFMDNNRSLNMIDLLSIRDAQRILEESRYRPK